MKFLQGKVIRSFWIDYKKETLNGQQMIVSDDGTVHSERRGKVSIYKAIRLQTERYGEDNLNFAVLLKYIDLGFTYMEHDQVIYRSDRQLTVEINSSETYYSFVLKGLLDIRAGRVHFVKDESGWNAVVK